MRLRVATRIKRGKWRQSEDKAEKQMEIVGKVDVNVWSRAQAEHSNRIKTIDYIYKNMKNRLRRKCHQLRARWRAALHVATRNSLEAARLQKGEWQSGELGVRLGKSFNSCAHCSLVVVILWKMPHDSQLKINMSNYAEDAAANRSVSRARPQPNTTSCLPPWPAPSPASGNAIRKVDRELPKCQIENCCACCCLPTFQSPSPSSSPSLPASVSAQQTWKRARGVEVQVWAGSSSLCTCMAASTWKKLEIWTLRQKSIHSQPATESGSSNSCNIASATWCACACCQPFTVTVSYTLHLLRVLSNCQAVCSVPSKD